jgi:S1-C subfamily serine protease
LTRLRIILLATFVFILSACSLSSSALSSLIEEEPEVAETQAATESSEDLSQAQVTLQTSPTLVSEPTPLPPEIVAEADAEEILLINIYERVNPSVVNIIVTVDDEELEANQLFPAQGQGSGFIYDKRAHCYE